MVDLGDLGLSSYEDRAYRSLIEFGPATAMEIAEASGVPDGRIYDVLASLETSGLVRVQTASRPKRYVAVEPDVAINRLVESRTRELEAEIDRYESAAQDLIEDLSPGERVEERFWTSAVGTRDALELLFERIDAADEQVVMVTDVVTPALDLADVGPDVLDRLAVAIERGVDVSLFLPRSLIDRAPAGLLGRITESPFDRESFSVRTTAAVNGNFYLIDHHELCFAIVNPIDRDSVVGMINIKDPTFAAELESQFWENWADGEPFEPATEGL